MKKIILAVIALSILFCGCAVKKHHPRYRVVTQIDVHTADGSVSYTRPEQLKTLLTYIRLLYPYQDARDVPENTDHNTYEIVMTCSDGSLRRYLQTDDRYFQINGGSWKVINPRYAVILPELLKILSSSNL